MDSRIVTLHRLLKAGMTGRETMIGKLAQGGVVTDMVAVAAVVVVEEAEHLRAMKGETTGTELVHMTVLEGEEAGHLLLIIENFSCFLMLNDEPFLYAF